MAQVEQQMQSLQAALETGTAAAAALQATNATLVAERMAAGAQQTTQDSSTRLLTALRAESCIMPANLRSTAPRNIGGGF